MKVIDAYVNSAQVLEVYFGTERVKYSNGVRLEADSSIILNSEAEVYPSESRFLESSEEQFLEANGEMEVNPAEFLSVKTGGSLKESADLSVESTEFPVIEENILLNHNSEVLVTDSELIEAPSDVFLNDSTEMFVSSDSLIFAKDACEANSITIENCPELYIESPSFVDNDAVSQVFLEEANEAYTSEDSLILEPEEPRTFLGSSCELWVEDNSPLSKAVSYVSFTDIVSLTAGKGKQWDGTMYYSFDSYIWSEWDGSTITNEQTNVIYVRGLGNTCLNTSFSPDSKWIIVPVPGVDGVSCYGEIENLLDYLEVSRGVHPTMGNYCFAYIFYRGEIVRPPLFSMVTTTVACFQWMFAYSSIKVLPRLSMTNFAQTCCSYMFAYCSNIKLSTSRTVVYLYPYRLPAEGTGTTGTNAMTNMFIGTSGTFKGTPSLNRYYYSANWMSAGAPTTVKITLTETEDLIQTFYYTQKNINSVLIDWGDGTSKSIYDGEKVTATHRYSTIGTYTVTFDCLAGSTWFFGQMVTEKNSGGREQTYYSSISCLSNAALTTEQQSLDYYLLNVIFAHSGEIMYVDHPNIVIKEIELGAGITTIIPCSFAMCTELERVTFSNEITGIGQFAFFKCFSLQNFELPNSIVDIDNGAFYGCTLMTELRLPDSCTSFGSTVLYPSFYGGLTQTNSVGACTALEKLILDSELQTYASSFEYGYYSNLNIYSYAAVPPSGYKYRGYAVKGLTSIHVLSSSVEAYKQVWYNVSDKIQAL